MKKRLVALAAMVIGVLLVTLPGALASPAAEPGLTKTSIKIGTTMPLSGFASLYANIATGMRVYFQHINTRRAAGDGKQGVYGRKIDFKIEDDAYNPSQTVQQTRKLVEQDRVFALVGGLGTEQQLAARQYLYGLQTSRRVPQVYVSTGATTWGKDHGRYRWTTGWQPDYIAESIMLADHLKATNPDAKVGILYQNDDFGQDYVYGFRSRAGRMLVASESYQFGASNVAPQLGRLRAAGATHLFIVATPGTGIPAIVTAYRFFGYQGTNMLVASVTATDSFLTAAQNAAGSGPEAVNGIVTTAYLKDPASSVYANDPQVRFYRTLMQRYGPSGANLNDGLYYYGMAKAADFVQALYRAGRNPTRASLAQAVENLTYRSPWVLPNRGQRGLVQTSPRSAYPLRYQRLARFNNGEFREFGPMRAIRKPPR